jgi:HlyD family secretion protein
VTLQTKRNAVTTAQNALTQAQDSLTLLQTQNPADLQKLADTIEQMKASLASKQAALHSTTTSTDVNIKLKQNDVAQKATSVQKAAKVLQDYQLAAPFDGLVTHLDYKKGDNLLDTGDTESVTIQNPDFIIVTIPLDQVDIVRVHKDLTANIVFDALPGQTFQGTIDSIDSTPIESSGVVSYNVSIKLPAPKDLTILSGMTATVTVETARKENVLVVPNLALRTQGSRITVQNAAGQNIPVTTGATDGQFTEILSGVQEGDSVVSVNVTATAANGANANAAQQFFRLGGGGGFGGPGAGGNGGGTRIRAGGG